jgi:LAS superfamily LD-carboxypeptidase LdcB
MAAPRVHPLVAAVARNLPRIAPTLGFHVKVTSVYRSRAQQAKLYADYVAGRSSLPANKPGYSLHERGLAIDLVSDNLRELVSFMSYLGFKWAGPKDYVHFYLA